MKILQLLFRVPFPLADGGAIAMHQMTKGFKENGADITILSFNTSKHYVDPTFLPSDMKALGKWHFVDLDNKVKPFGAFLNLFSNKSYHISRFESIKMRSKLKALLQEEEFDVVHFEGLYTGIYVDIVKKYAPKAKTVLRAHNVEHLIWERMINEASFLKKFYLKLLTERLKKAEVKALPKFDAVVPITSVDEHSFKKLGVAHQFVSPTGYDLKPLPKTQKKPYTVYHLGSMDWQPNQEAVIWFMEHVWLKVKQAVPEAKFYLAGRNMPESFTSFNKVPGVHVVGEVEDATVFASDKSVSVIPILSGSGLRIKIIEGLAIGKAIVSTSIGAEGVEYTDGDNICIADDPKTFATAIIELLLRPSKAKEIESGARKLAEEKYSNFVLVGRLLAFYESLLEK